MCSNWRQNKAPSMKTGLRGLNIDSMREPKSCLGRVFNYKLGCFNDVHVFIYVFVCPMFVERKVLYSALFTNLVGWHADTVSFPLSDVILAQLACPLRDVMFCLHSGITNLSLYKHCLCPHLQLKTRPRFSPVS